MALSKNKIDEKEKLKSVISVLKLGHETFKKQNFQEICNHILNNSALAFRYERAAIVDMHGDAPKVVSVMGEAQVNANSEYCIQIRKLANCLKKIDSIKVVNNELVEELGSNERLLKCKKYFDVNGNDLIVAPLFPPESQGDLNECYFWIVEVSKNMNIDLNIITLLAHHYSEGIWYFNKRSESRIDEIIRKKMILTPINILLICLGVFFIILFIKIPQNVAADFELIPKEEVISYAPFDGTINECKVNNGVTVSKGETIMKYNIDEFKYKLASSQNALAKTIAERNLAKQRAFEDDEELDKVKLLGLESEKYQIDIERMNWYLKKSIIHAEMNGTVVLDDTEKWSGKFVKAGDKLFELVNKHNIIAEVMLNEVNGSVLGENMKVNLYLHSQPEKAIRGIVTSISPKPILTDTGEFAYMIKVKIPDVKPNYIFGMRGVARVSGSKVTIGYYLFRNLILWWRKA